ncbi:class I lanthipeptide [Sphingobacterium sp.]|uniref:class I lanthipeptide n=1 Tax=Sphingobacterium sp. TaxID=341027 RepID=UPI00289CA7B2|nr:class I lanthipeptide [Sphingobacterium sp.]
MKKKILKFSKQDIADLSQEEQRQIIGGNNAPTVGENCTITCEDNGCNTYKDGDCTTTGDTGPCPSHYRGTACDPKSGMDNATCYISAGNVCHSMQQCTYADCTQGCPTTYGDATCKNCNTK